MYTCTLCRFAYVHTHVFISRIFDVPRKAKTLSTTLPRIKTGVHRRKRCQPTAVGRQSIVGSRDSKVCESTRNTEQLRLFTGTPSTVYMVRRRKSTILYGDTRSTVDDNTCMSITYRYVIWSAVALKTCRQLPTTTMLLRCHGHRYTRGPLALRSEVLHRTVGPSERSLTMVAQEEKNYSKRQVPEKVDNDYMNTE